MPPSKINRGFLDRCESEQLQFSGAIQPHGAFFIFQSDGFITHRSENLPDFFTTDLIAKGVVPDSIRGFAQQLEISAGAKLYGNDWLCDREMDLVLTRAGNGAILAELYLSDLARRVPSYTPPPELATFDSESDLKRARSLLIQWIARVTGYERVMYYQFLPSGEGEVLNEITQSEASGSYLGLRFPASDIPQIARNIYMKTPWRTIADASAHDVKVYSSHENADLLSGAETPDLTYVDLRSVSPIHAIYMQNMGDLASFSIPLVGTTELEALISCHSPQAGFLPISLQQTISDHCRLFNSLAREFRTRLRIRVLDEFSYQTSAMIEQLTQLSTTEQGWDYLSDWLVTQFDVDGCVLLGDQLALQHGETPDESILYEIDCWFGKQPKEFHFQTDRLADTFPDSDFLTTTAGFTCVKFTAREGINHNLYLFRQEVIQEVSWGGNPDKPIEQHDGVLGIAPRQSFARWVEKKMGYCRPWSNENRFKLLHLRSALNNHINLLEEVEP